jgi:hypothetical protein
MLKVSIPKDESGEEIKLGGGEESKNIYEYEKTKK